MTISATWTHRRPGLIVGAEIDPAGSHPAAWQSPGSEPYRVLDSSYLVALVQIAERGGLAFASLPGTLAHPPAAGHSGPLHRSAGDAALVAGRLARITGALGLAPVIAPIRAACEARDARADAATLDHLTRSRAAIDLARAEDVEALGAHWSRVDDAGPGISRFDAAIDDVFALPTPAGRPVHDVPIIVPVRDVPSAALAGRLGDIARVSALDEGGLVALGEAVRSFARSAPGGPRTVRVLSDLPVVLDADLDAAARRSTQLASQRAAFTDIVPGAHDPWAGLTHVGTPGALAVRLESWWREGVIDGVLLRGAAAPSDLLGVVDGLIPELGERGLIEADRRARPLRERFGLPPVDRAALSAAAARRDADSRELSTARGVA